MPRTEGTSATRDWQVIPSSEVGIVRGKNTTGTGGTLLLIGNEVEVT